MNSTLATRIRALVHHSSTPRITKEQAKALGNELHVDWKQVDLRELRRGIEVELEHKGTLEKLGVREDDILKAATRIALDHLSEDGKYYSKLKKVEGK